MKERLRTMVANFSLMLFGRVAVESVGKSCSWVLHQPVEPEDLIS